MNFPKLWVKSKDGWLLQVFHTGEVFAGGEGPSLTCCVSRQSSGCHLLWQLEKELTFHRVKRRRENYRSNYFLMGERKERGLERSRMRERDKQEAHIETWILLRIMKSWT